MDSRNNKDPIERLFQQKAEEYDISYQEKDWLKLEKQLDQHDQMLASRRMRWFIAAAVLLLFSLLGYAIYQNSQEIDRLHQQLQDQQFAQDSRNNQPNTSDAAGQDNETTSENSRPSSQTSPAMEKQRDDNNASTYTNASVEPGNRVQPTESTNFIVSADAVKQLPSNPACADCGMGNLAERALPVVSPTHDLVAGEEDSPYLAATEEQDQSLSSSQVASRSQTEALASRVSVGLLAGPDLSTAGSLADFHSPGYSLGLSIAYRLHPSVSIQAGFIRSVSRYVAGSNDYHPPQTFWGYGAAADKTTAECLILDIPVSIKYDWAHFDRSRIFATAGISSYIMLSEDYKFEYASASSDQSEGWYGETGTKHWSSNINLSIGYEYDLNNRFGLRVEPFLKLPVREVGWGNVKLYSLGSFISFNYNIY